MRDYAEILRETIRSRDEVLAFNKSGRQGRSDIRETKATLDAIRTFRRADERLLQIILKEVESDNEE